jgi:hypothetical protein
LYKGNSKKRLYKGAAEQNASKAIRTEFEKHSIQFGNDFLGCAGATQIFGSVLAFCNDTLHCCLPTGTASASTSEQMRAAAQQG